MSVQTMEVGLKAFDERYFKHRIEHTNLDNFGSNLVLYVKKINAAVEADESEEHIKKIINDFLEHTFYNNPDYDINTYQRVDSSIKYKSTLLAIIETKKPKKKGINPEMIGVDNINRKALWEIILYYLNETRLTDGKKVKNNTTSELRRLLITDSRDWFIFDAQHIDKICDGYLENQFYKYQNGLLSFSNAADKFYSLIEEYFNEIDITKKLSFIHFRVDNVLAQRSQWQYMYKVLYKAFLLKDGYKQLSETHVLNSKFYKELLYLMGLKEEKKDGKKQILIDNNIHNSLINQVMSILLNDKGYLDITKAEEEAFNLVIIWINRLLFIKLFEGQLLSFNGDEPCYHILDNDKINNFKELNELFFDVFGSRERSDTDFINQFSEIPYLNSSLFERYPVERNVININSIQNELVAVKIGSVLGKQNASLPLLVYLINFLNAYSFSSQITIDGSVTRKNEIIDASVLGLIFEKINGYRDGSFYTKGFVTEYICRNIIEATVINKINETLKWNVKSIDELKFRINRNSLDEITTINELINSIKICDPAVGSGHFLVSAMNCILSLKNELGVLMKADNSGLFTEYDIAVIDDILCVYDGQGNEFRYDKTNSLSQNIQKTLFKEKQTIIENCLFGVDINPNAVAICQLRLWIELLKNAYYENGIMQTLPNVDINIKCGNSLVQKLNYEVGQKISNKNMLTADELKLLKDYKEKVKRYKTTSNKGEKQFISSAIDGIKNSLYSFYSQLSLVTINDKGDVSLQWDSNSPTTYNNYARSFEWSIEFPEVIDEKGTFLGFDCIIGNPPYISVQGLEHQDIDYYKNKYKTAYKRLDISTLFFELANKLISKNGLISYITSNQFLTADYGEKIREYLTINKLVDSMIDFGDLPVFDDALTYVSIFFLSKKRIKGSTLNYYKVKELPFIAPQEDDYISIRYDSLSSAAWELESDDERNCMDKIRAMSRPLKDIAKCNYGVITGQDDILMFDVDDTLPFEKELSISVIRADGCNRYGYATPSKQIFYPYKENTGETVIIPLSEIKDTYPLAYNYIMDNQNALKARKDSRKIFGDRTDWYGLVRFGVLQKFKQAKIVSPGEVKHNKFCIDTSNSAFSGARVFSVTVTDNNINIRCLLALLNSKLCEFYMHKVAPLKQGGYYSYSTTIIDNFPIKFDNSKTNEILALVSTIENHVQNGKDASSYESKLDDIIYAMYDLDATDINIIEKFLSE